MINSGVGFPRWVKLAAGFLVVIAFIALFLTLYLGKTEMLNQFADFALIITLAVLICYCYSTYLLAKEAWTISATYQLVPTQDDPYHFVFVLHNLSKFSLECYCKLNASIYKKPIELGGFFNGESSFNLQPHQAGSCAALSIDLFLKKDNRKIEQMIEDASDQNHKQQLYLDIDFWYYQFGSDAKFHSPKQPQFFDFRKKTWVTDF